MFIPEVLHGTEHEKWEVSVMVVVCYVSSYFALFSELPSYCVVCKTYHGSDIPGCQLDIFGG